MMMENKRNVCSLEDNSIKRHKSDLSFSSKERKDKVGERISALQQLVSPYGKTDTASVLLEAMQYIQFLQEQVKVCSVSFTVSNLNCICPSSDPTMSFSVQVLSAPYLQTTPITTHEEKLGEYRLRSRGLCLVPMEYTVGVAQTNGADIWAPVKTPV
ncbi:transcription factor bHLH153-like isoform X1 [Brassica napus]|uniref:transcription factor bHLH153-like isoform X1 n=1 Tax=Brassica napus TaxID=3708 RepID=UPI002078F43D|nr:transcription factor bHLH153-like isoform X1 [Brassica napus]